MSMPAERALCLAPDRLDVVAVYKLCHASAPSPRADVAESDRMGRPHTGVSGPRAFDRPGRQNGSLQARQGLGGASPFGAVWIGLRHGCRKELPFKLNQDRRHHIPEQTRKVTNWRDYDESLRRRGSLTVWFSDEAVEAWLPDLRSKADWMSVSTPITRPLIWKL